MRALYRKRLGIPLLVTLTVAVVCAVVWWQPAQNRPKRFAVVAEGRLYRSGEVDPTQLEHLVRDYRIRTVVSLLDADAPESVAERRTAEKLGIAWHCIPLPGNGASTPAERAQIKRLLFDSAAAPIKSSGEITPFGNHKSILISTADKVFYAAKINLIIQGADILSGDVPGVDSVRTA